ncbi:MAG: histidine phosphatase family protein [Thiohalomonadales bacterium]
MTAEQSNSFDHLLTTVDIIRHGEPVGGKMYRGHKDDPLSEKGWRQMRNAVGNFSSWDTIVSSPLIRCSEFAAEISTIKEKPLHLEERFKEIDWGIWEGCTTEYICRENPNALLKFRAAPLEHKPANAESVLEFYTRVVAAWQDLIQAHKNRHVLLVAHAGITRCIMCHILDIPAVQMFRIYVSNAAVTRFEIVHTEDADYGRLIFHDGVPD